MTTPWRTIVLSTALTVLGSTLLLLQYVRASNGNFDFGGATRGGLSPILGEYIDENQRPMWGESKPWADRTCHSHPDDMPETGITRHYNFSIGYGKFSPDGFEKEMIVVNNQFPGPGIEANWGDWIEVEVHNNLKEGTSLHWHGILQRETPWADGVPGITQCPIAPGEKLVYRFRASNYGTSWYHSHLSAQYSMGLYGPIIIHGPRHYKYDVDLGVVFINDWYHRFWGTDPEVILPNLFPDNILIGGKNNYNCSLAKEGQECYPNAELSKFFFQTGKTHVLHLVHSGSGEEVFFSIDEHEFTVVSLDFVPIIPYTTNGIMLGIGQRVDILVAGTGKATGAYRIRVHNHWAQGCPLEPFLSPPVTGLATIYYERTSVSDPAIPPFIDSKPWPPGQHCDDSEPMDLTEPYRVESVATEDVLTVNLEMKVGVNGTGFFFVLMNDVSFKTNLSDPMLKNVALGETKFPDEYNVIDTGNAKRVRFVIANNMEGKHPIHMHGHIFQILSNAPGLTWDGTIANPSNPLRRDTAIVDSFSTIVLQIDANNPGVWPLHCHVAWHVSAGMAVQFIERRHDIEMMIDRKGNEIEDMAQSSCRAWDRWVEKNGDGQIDSGWSLDG